ncbi:High-affinity glucose transporter [Tolypocladium capitatum]|uniref:High-affinity glucose transporter n=1 Tax=Tolypocladium capitatum TaxID=45235 RepID=A0A2K3QDK4_9HYPO|nr:High-affinity glucose transporter [Tolypocladium capitatum]
MLKRVVLGMSIQAWSQLCGMNIMMYHIVYVMGGAEIGSPLLSASIQYIINFVFTLPAILFLDKWPSLVVGSCLMMALLFTPVNAAAFIHMFVAAHETKGYTLEEMDDVFDEGTRAWQARGPRGSRLEQLQRQIERGTAKMRAPAAGEVPVTRC